MGVSEPGSCIDALRNGCWVMQYFIAEIKTSL